MHTACCIEKAHTVRIFIIAADKIAPDPAVPTPSLVPLLLLTVSGGGPSFAPVTACILLCGEEVFTLGLRSAISVLHRMVKKQYKTTRDIIQGKREKFVNNMCVISHINIARSRT